MKKNTELLKVILAGLVLGMVYFPGHAAAKEPRISASIEAAAESPLTREEQRNVSLAGGRILKHVNQARFAVLKDPKQAGEHIRKALTLVDIIKKVAPVYSVQAKIQSEDLIYEDQDNIRPLYVTIFDELDRVSVLSPVIEAKKIAEDSRIPAGAGLRVSGSYPSYTRVFFDLAFAEKSLKDASDALKENNPQLADAFLTAIQLSVVFEYKALDLPLSRASENLLLAKTLSEEGRGLEAQVALQAVVEALGLYKERVPQEKGGEVDKLRSEIISFIPQMKEGAKVNGAGEKITSWWDRIVTWFA